jgi:Bacteriophage tail sheath protein
VSVELLSSKVAIVEERPALRGIPGLPTSVAGAVGIAERGPIGQAVLCTSWEEYQRTFGGFTTQSDLALAALGFFQNGGAQLWVVRTVHYTSPADPATATAAKATAALVATPGTEVVLRIEAKHAGAYGNRLSVDTTAATNTDPDAFDLVVLEAGLPRERWPNLSMSAIEARYIERIVNDGQRGSRYVRAVDPHALNAPVPPPQVVFLAGGGDGLSGLVDNDFLGSELGGTGLHALDGVADLSIVLIPGRTTAAVQTGLLRYCEIDRAGMLFAVLDPPPGARATQMVAYVAQVGLEGLTEHGALYWPRVRISNPDQGIFGSDGDLVVPPSGIIAGVYARTDAARQGGVFSAPAGVDTGRMLGVLGFETDESNDERKRDLVYPHRINPLRTDAGAPRYIDGSRTLKGDGNFPSIPERRGVSFLERSLKRALESARHRPNDESLRAELHREVTGFLTDQMNVGAFATRDPKTAFFVDVDSLNDAAARFRGEFHLRVGIATNKPAEFIVLHVSQADLASTP